MGIFCRLIKRIAVDFFAYIIMGRTVRAGDGSRSVSSKSDHSHYSRGGCGELDRAGHHARRNKCRSSLADREPLEAVSETHLKTQPRFKNIKGKPHPEFSLGTFTAIGGNSCSYPAQELVRCKQLVRRG